jgi:hypothetical protein
MRYFLGFLCVCALGVVPLVGCEAAGDGTPDVFPCTEQGIRDAIARGGGPHTFDCNGPTTVVTEAEIVIDNDVILDGEGNLAVDGNDDHRVFSVTTGGTAKLRGMTVARGSAQNAGPVDGIGVIGRRTFGGGIVSVGTLTLTDATVLGNYAAAGAGIYSEGTLTLTDSAVSGNDAEDSGAGLVNGGSGTLTLANSTVSGNQAATFGHGLGAGIHNEGEMTIINSTITGNLGGHAEGGGIYNAGSGTLSLINSTLSRNRAGADGPARGGGIYNWGEMTVINSIVSENRVAGLGGGFGGGIYNGGGMSLTNTTVSSNTAIGGFGGGIYSSGRTLLINTTVASNLADSADDSADAIYIGTGGYLEVARTVIHGDCDEDVEDGSNVTWVSLGYNIESLGDTCGFDHATDLVGITEGQLDLGELANNGGPTMTHALGADSVAIDHIPAVDCGVTTDQRGEPRPVGDGCDVGSFERQPEDP